MKISSSSETPEHQLVQRIKSWTGSRYIGDDCAVLPSGLLVSTDTLVEGTHFRLATTSLADLGWKAIAVNLSDIAAMGGRPRHLLVSVGFPATMSEREMESLYGGFVDCANRYRTRIVGGDLVKARDLTISVTVMGETHEHGVFTRSGAEVGDVVIVTGDFGASAAGFYLLEHGETETLSAAEQAGVWRANRSGGTCVTRHRRPLPRLCESWALNRAALGAGALMDASDGLADALVQIARSSNVALRVDLKNVPVHDETLETAQKAGRDPLDWVLYGGEDYELVACISEQSWQRLQGFEHNPFKAIGIVEDGDGVSLTLGGKCGPDLDLEKCFQHTSAPN
ncbi:MAG: thiamine-phosphate kinase [Candidatus Melainabacteria bacterium]|nr:thiamine-phosphate kinase [Candidatus Melainabacteria bacterium]